MKTVLSFSEHKSLVRWVVYNQLYDRRFLFAGYCPCLLHIVCVDVPRSDQRDRKKAENNININDRINRMSLNCSLPFTWYKTAMLGRKSRTGARPTKDIQYIVLNGNFLCLSCPRATSASQYGGFVPREWQATKGLLDHAPRRDSLWVFSKVKSWWTLIKDELKILL